MGAMGILEVVRAMGIVEVWGAWGVLGITRVVRVFGVWACYKLAMGIARRDAIGVGSVDF